MESCEIYLALFLMLPALSLQIRGLQEETYTSQISTRTSGPCTGTETQQEQKCQETFMNMGTKNMTWIAGYQKKASDDEDQKSYDYSGTSSQGFITKGCYGYNDGIYKGHYFFGKGGTETQRRSTLFAPQFRPECKEGSQEFPQLDGLIEERIEEDFIHEHGNDIEMIQNSILEIDTSDQDVVPSGRTGSGVQCLDNSGQLCFEEHGRIFKRIPDTPQEVNTHFFLLTPTNPFESTRHNPSNWTSSWPLDFDWKLPLKIIIHGFRETSNSLWIRELTRKFFLATGNRCNIILVDWRDGARAPRYTRAAANTRLVGLQVARMVQEMEFIFNDRSIRSRTHIIGFSLGAHTAGNAGMYFALEANKESTNTSTSSCTKLHQISGLDPAGPLFENVPPSIRLDPSDACFVDVIHTNAGSLPTLGLGIRRPCGNVDFYPNGGSRQPECRNLIIGSFNQFLGKDVGKSVACNHIRAAEYYIESISRDIISPAYPCKGEQEYESGKCFSHEQMEYIGFDWSVNNNFREHQVYQVTRKTLPYIGKQVKITVQFRPSENPLESSFFGPSTQTKGSFTVYLQGAGKDDLEAIELTRGQELNWQTSLQRVSVVRYDFKVKGVQVEYARTGLFFFLRTQWSIGFNITVTDGDKLNWSGDVGATVLDSGSRLRVLQTT